MANAQSSGIEEWRPVVGHELLYSVSSLGRVRRNRPTRKTMVGQCLAPHVCSGYEYVTLYRGTTSADRVRPAIHVLVAEAFHGPRPVGQQVNHKNGLKTDNRPENLEWCTQEANRTHAIFVLGAFRRGEKCGHSLLTDNIVREIRAARARGESMRALARSMGLSQATVVRASSGRTWSHVA